MTPLESMSAGKPCIGVFDGGIRETIIDKITGKFIPADYNIEDIIKAVKWITPERALKMREVCEAQAERFSYEKFINQMRLVVGE